MAGPFLSAFVLGLSANLFARVTRQPAELFTVPGLALLVPGSFGVRSMSALLSDQTTLSVDMAFHMFLTAMALVTGLLFSGALCASNERSGVRPTPRLASLEQLAGGNHGGQVIGELLKIRPSTPRGSEVAARRPPRDRSDTTSIVAMSQAP